MSGIFLSARTPVVKPILLKSTVLRLAALKWFAARLSALRLMLLTPMILKPILVKHTAALFCSLFLLACTPTVQVAAPDKPIEINLNVKIEHEIRVKVDKELDELFEKDSTLF